MKLVSCENEYCKERVIKGTNSPHSQKSNLFYVAYKAKKGGFIWVAFWHCLSIPGAISPTGGVSLAVSAGYPLEFNNLRNALLTTRGPEDISTGEK